MSKKEIKGVASSVELRETLNRAEERLHGKDDLFSMSAMTHVRNISAPRLAMLNAHLQQFNNLVKPEVARVITNYENVAGVLSTGYMAIENETEVYKIIPKFNMEGVQNHLYLMFLYDVDNECYRIVEKKNVEDLTEKFGFSYNTDKMDSLREGDTIQPGEWLYHSDSYDEYRNYCIGRNVKFAYAIYNPTIEDAIEVSDSLAKEMISKEVEPVRVTLNDNDIFVNLYGDKDEYKGFPDVGEYVKDGVICAKRRIFNNQLLFDLKNSRLRKINNASDRPFYCKGKVEDIVIYSNKNLDEFEDNRFNRQIVKYLKMQQEFYTAVYETCNEIINSGKKYSDDINYWYKRAKDILDPEVKWRDDMSVFNHVIIEFLMERDVNLSEGQKITGRYGNKGVISNIRPDDEMPVLETGERVDIIFNTLGVINRLNSQQLFEQSITFVCNRTVERMKTLKTNEQRDELLLRMINYFNEKQAAKVADYLKTCGDEDYKSFYDDVYERGMIIHIPPMWDDTPLFERLTKIYQNETWIKPYDVFVKKFGRFIKIMTPMIVGDMYVIKLKQSSKKGMSARSTGPILRKGVPAKTKKYQEHQDVYSKTPIRIGGDENNNISIGMGTDMVAKMHMLYRSSVIGRQVLGRELATNLLIDDVKLDKKVTNRNVEILNAFLKTLGLRLRFVDTQINVKPMTSEIRAIVTDSGEINIGNDKDFARQVFIEEIKEDERGDLLNIMPRSNQEYEKYLEEEIQKRFSEMDY